VNKPGMVEVQVFNVRGELVKTLAKQWYPQGEHTVTWDGRTENGIGAPSGMYFAVAKSNGSTDRMKMMLMK
jgi:flagellar hook assembly protein FlgD